MSLKSMSESFIKRLFFIEMWRVGVIDKPLSRVSLEDKIEDVIWLDVPGGFGCLENPILIERKGKKKILANYSSYLKPKKKVVELEIPDDEDTGLIMKDIIVSGHSLLNPHIFEYLENLYCAVSSPDVQKISLYRENSGQWEFERDILEGVQATSVNIFEYLGVWWLFYDDSSGLHILYSDHPLGNWQLHEKDPVLNSDGTLSSAGSIFIQGDKLLRPCSDGRVIHINRIEVLSISEFSEKHHVTMEPDPSGECPDGVQTINELGRITVVDGKKSKFSVLAPFLRLIS